MDKGINLFLTRALLPNVRKLLAPQGFCLSQTSTRAGLPQEGRHYAGSVFPAKDIAQRPAITSELLACSKRREKSELREL